MSDDLTDDQRMRKLMAMMTLMQVVYGENPQLDEFSDDEREGEDKDTLNRAADAGLLEIWHDSLMDSSRIKITQAGLEWAYRNPREDPITVRFDDSRAVTIIASDMARLATARNDALEEAAKIAQTAWVSADYDTVGIADADMAMRLCEHTAAAIRALKSETKP